MLKLRQAHSTRISKCPQLPAILQLQFNCTGGHLFLRAGETRFSVPGRCCSPSAVRHFLERGRERGIAAAAYVIKARVAMGSWGRSAALLTHAWLIDERYTISQGPAFRPCDACESGIISWNGLAQEKMTSFLTTMFVPVLPLHLALAGNPWLCGVTTRHYRNRSCHYHTCFHGSNVTKRDCSLRDNCSNARARGQFKPRNANKGTSSYQLRQFAEATLGSGSLRKAVKLPEGEDLSEWLAVNGRWQSAAGLDGQHDSFWSFWCSRRLLQSDQPSLWIHYRILLPSFLPGDESDRWVRVSLASYPRRMSMTPYRFEYLWQDTEKYKRPTKMPAPEYIEHLMAWVQGNIDNEVMFPSRIGTSYCWLPNWHGQDWLQMLGVPFPKTFPSLIRQLFKRLYRVYAHIYCHHYPVIIQLGLEPHLNTSFKHYVLFIDEHSLANGKDFWGPLGDLVDNMLRSDWRSVGNSLVSQLHRRVSCDRWFSRLGRGVLEKAHPGIEITEVEPNASRVFTFTDLAESTTVGHCWRDLSIERRSKPL